MGSNHSVTVRGNEWYDHAAPRLVAARFAKGTACTETYETVPHLSDGIPPSDKWGNFSACLFCRIFRIFFVRYANYISLLEANIFKNYPFSCFFTISVFCHSTYNETINREGGTDSVCETKRRRHSLPHGTSVAE